MRKVLIVVFLVMSLVGKIDAVIEYEEVREEDNSVVEYEQYIVLDSNESLINS